MNNYLNFLAKSAGFDGVCCAEGWQSRFFEKDGREMPMISVFYDPDNNVWNGWIGVDFNDHGPDFAHPHEAFAWLKTAVAEYQFPVCEQCQDSGLVHWVVGEDEGEEPCGCFAGERVKAAIVSAIEDRAEAMSRR